MEHVRSDHLFPGTGRAERPSQPPGKVRGAPSLASMRRSAIGCGFLLALAGCTSISAEGGASRAACERAIEWERGGQTSARRIEPSELSEEDGRRYGFELEGAGGLRSLEAQCGWGSYGECTFRAVETGGEEFDFSDLSTFALWEADGALYLVYRIIAPKDASDSVKRRVVRLQDPPATVCNEIGDYSDVM